MAKKSEVTQLLEQVIKEYRRDITDFKQELRDAINGRCWERAAEMETRIDVIAYICEDLTSYLRSSKLNGKATK